MGTGRVDVRYLARALLFCGLILPYGSPAFANKVSLTLTDLGQRAYRLEGHFVASVSRQVAWEVLTDYNHIGQFVSSIQSSQLKERNDTLIVEQKAIARFLFFSRTLYVLLRVREEPFQKISFEDTAHRDFEFYVGSWHMEESPEGLWVHYSVKARSALLRPAFIERSIFEQTARGLLGEVRSEILRRAAQRQARKN